jgi:hypothetical protein
VSERTKVSILAGSWVFAVMLAKLSFISGGVVELLDFVVRLRAVAVGLGAQDVTVVVKVGPAAVLLIVVVKTNFAIV